MALRILDATTRAAVNAATTQQGVCEALIEPWAGGNVTARLFAADGTTLLRTLTLGPFTINSSDPRGVVCAAHQADTHVATGAPGLWVFRVGSTDIFSIDAGTSGASVNHVGAVKALCTPTLAGVVLTANASLPVTPQPDALLDLMVTARAAAGASEWTWVQVNTNDITDAFPPVGLRDPFSGGEGIAQMVSAWGGHVYNPDSKAAEANGTGHSAAGCTEWLRWSLLTREWSLSYYGAEQIACPAPYYRARDFNGTPPSAHPYDNQCYGRVRQRIYQAYAGTFNSGNRGRVWNTGETGDQSNGADGQPGANYTGIFEIDMAQAGTGKVLGATGTNAASGANAGTSLTGANAALLHDWLGTGPAPTFEGSTLALTTESSMAYTDEVSGKDAFFWTAGNKWLVLTTINSANPADDTHQLVCRDGSVYGAGRASVQISLDPTLRVVVAVTNDADTNPGAIKFADLKRTWGASNGWRDATLTGSDIAEFLALNRIDMGCKYDPVSGKHLLYNGVGRQVWAITTPATDGGTGFTPDTGWALEKLPMNASSAAPPASADTFQTAGGVEGADFIIGINGNWQHHDDVRAQCAILGRQGDVWYLLGPDWTDPRTP